MMNDNEQVLHGIVLSSMPMGENDKRLTILTKERGKLSAFARGARRPNSPLLASTEPFAFGCFTVYEGRSSNNLTKTEISHYFREIASDPDAVWLGFYFLELADFYSFENLEAGELLALLFYSLKALMSDTFSNALVRRVFELRTLVIAGEYPDPDRYKLSQSGDYTMRYIISTPLKELYRFTVTPEVLKELGKVLDDFFRAYVDHRFRSLAVLESL